MSSCDATRFDTVKPAAAATVAAGAARRPTRPRANPRAGRVRHAQCRVLVGLVALVCFMCSAAYFGLAAYFVALRAESKRTRVGGSPGHWHFGLPSWFRFPFWAEFNALLRSPWEHQLFPDNDHFWSGYSFQLGFWISILVVLTVVTVWALLSALDDRCPRRNGHPAPDARPRPDNRGSAIFGEDSYVYQIMEEGEGVRREGRQTHPEGMQGEADAPPRIIIPYFPGEEEGVASYYRDEEEGMPAAHSPRRPRRRYDPRSPLLRARPDAVVQIRTDEVIFV